MSDREEVVLYGRLNGGFCPEGPFAACFWNVVVWSHAVRVSAAATMQKPPYGGAGYAAESGRIFI
jgi:hypothetical protein